jgi:hypothetical protein
VADAVLNADPLRGVGLVFGLVRGGEGGGDRWLVLPPGRPRGEHRNDGLGAQALIPGISQQGDARHEGEQFDQAGLADLGQIVDGAWASLTAKQQPSGRVGDTSALTVLARALPETNRCRPAL